MLQVDGVSKRFRSESHVKEALRDIHLQINEGEIVGLVGESGSGKSTLSRIIMQLESPDEGKVYWNGQVITKENRKDFYKECQLIFQNAMAAMNPSWTVLEILREPLQSKNHDAKIKKILKKVQLGEEILTRRPAELSGGERQRVNVLRSILVQPKLLLCDEIVSNLDRLIQKEMIDLLIKISRDSGMGILFIAHDIKAVNYLCERVYVMKDGEIVDSSWKSASGFKFTHPYARKLFE